MITSYDFKFCYIKVYKDYVISIMKEGITVTPESIIKMSFIVEKHFKNNAFVYVSYRINSYSLNPIFYFEVNKLKNLIAIAVVSEDLKQKKQSRIEKTFFERELQQFDTLKTALEWKDIIIKKHKEGLPF